MQYIKRGIAAVLLAAILMTMIPAAMAASYTGTINADKVFFRLYASSNSVYHCQLKKGTKVTVTDEKGDFYKVTYNKNTGYVMKKYVTLSSDAKKALNGSSSSSASSGNKYAGITTIAKLGNPPSATQKGSSGDHVYKLQQALKIKGYYKSVVDGIYGDQTASAVKAYQKAVGLSQTGKADSTTISKLFGKTTTTTAASDPKMNGITKISQITVPGTSKKGDSGKNVLALQQALKLKGYYTGPIDSKYGDMTVAAVKAFQKSKGLAQDGTAGNATIKALFGKNAANHSYTTERLDWFNGGSSVFSGTCVYTIKDVNTGKMFQARRRFGTNHLDSEPLTASDTAIMKSIYGGEWSWNRRAILVLYNGHVYAASMNGMPHGTSSISGNNFDGHFCIHFYKSKTHGTQNVDSAHQNCVARAMNATW